MALCSQQPLLAWLRNEEAHRQCNGQISYLPFFRFENLHTDTTQLPKVSVPTLSLAPIKGKIERLSCNLASSRRLDSETCAPRLKADVLKTYINRVRVTP